MKVDIVKITDGAHTLLYVSDCFLASNIGAITRGLGLMNVKQEVYTNIVGAVFGGEKDIVSNGIEVKIETKEVFSN